MRIVCDSCGAKYSIPDDRVGNKPFKIRCKKCAHTIIVDHSAAASAGVAAASVGGFGEAVWYVVLDGEQAGPMTAQDVEAYFQSGQVEADSFIWRDGFGNWKPLTEVPEFTHLSGGDPLADVFGGGDYEATRQVNVGEVFGDALEEDEEEGDGATRVVSMSSLGIDHAADVFGGHENGVSEATVVAVRSPYYNENDEADLDPSFAAAAAAMSAPEPVMEPAPEPEPEPEPKPAVTLESLASMGVPVAGRPSPEPEGEEPRRSSEDLVGARSDNSVLFSLNNLRSVGSDLSSGSDGAMPTTEASGLIDVNALASTHSAMNGPADNRQSFNGDAFDNAVMPVPAMMPMGARKSNTGLIVGISIAAILLIGLAVVVIVLMLGKDEKGGDETKGDSGAVGAPQVAGQGGPGAGAGVGGGTQGAPPSETSSSGASGQPPVGSSSGGQSPPGDVVASNNGAPQGSPPEGQNPDEKNGTSTEGGGGDGTPTEENGGTPTAVVDPKPEPKPEPKPDPKPRPKPKPKPDPKPKPKPKPKPDPKPEPKPDPKPTSSKPALTKQQVQGVVLKNFAKVKTCGRNADVRGKLKVKWTIKQNGRTSGVSIVSSEFKGSKVGDCVKRVVQGMRFPQHGGDPANITYPFNI